MVGVAEIGKSLGKLFGNKKLNLFKNTDGFKLGDFKNSIKKTFENFKVGILRLFFYKSENEPKVIMAYYNGNEYEIIGDLAEDFGAFLLQLVQEQLDSQQD